ncbi:epimerase [Kineobactrum sediminis]|uniref:Epimerase n=1 Tax=Kineobactrum sediminis TaxID=1905677 RepID=A0A2N5XXX6_9GAMM|nr:NAD-dependent epimerase/dehydratase family protein [Kineobactrum sediminis]PLW81001.1 epimerase [Kineobactrum sediminis]
MVERVLIIGATGFIGQALCQAFTQGGSRVRAVSRSGYSSTLDVEEHVACDCTDPAELAGLLQDMDAVIYLAATSTPGSSAGRPVDEVTDNLTPLTALLEALQANPTLPLIYFSSAGALYGEHPQLAATEDTPPQPRSYHGAAKVAAEQFIHAWSQQFNGTATILRPSNVYGPGQQERDGFGIIPKAFGCILRGDPITIWGDGSAVRDYLYIDDLVALALMALEQPLPGTVRTLNAASGEAVDLNELFAIAEWASGGTLERRYTNTRMVDASTVLISATKAYQTLGWKPHVPLKEGLKRTWLWFESTQH